MKQWWFYLVVVLSIVSLGCGGAGEKGKNSAKDDRPKAAKDE
jgi:hypothetical protein